MLSFTRSRAPFRLAVMSSIVGASILAPAALVAADGAAKPPPPPTITVDDDRAQCPNAQFTTVQAAVDAAAPGTQISVCDGTYPEQVRIATPAKDGLRITGTGVTRVTIKAPAVMTEPGDLVTVDGAKNVVIERLTVAGPLPDALFCAESLRSGLRIVGAATAALRDMRVTEIRAANPALFGCQNGFAVAVGRTFEAQTGRVTMERVLLDRYQKGGLYVDNAGSNADLNLVAVIGDGPNAIIGQNGMQISRNATATVRNSIVNGNSYTLQPLASGILIFDAGRVQVSGNSLSGNDFGIDVEGASTKAVVTGNRVAGSTAGDGIFASADSAGNVFQSNVARNNGEHDCHDDSHGTGTAGTANNWRNNTGTTATPVGICRPAERH